MFNYFTDYFSGNKSFKHIENQLEEVEALTNDDLLKDNQSNTIDYSQYVNKIWVVDKWSGGDYENYFSLLITNIKKEELEGKILKNDNCEEDMVKRGCVKITDDEANPYSTETFVGSYLYDIFEASRGSCTDEDLFADEVFEYYDIFNPLQEEHYNMDWSISLAIMKGSTPLANNFNQRTYLIEWNRLEDVLSQEIVNGLENL